MALGQSLLDRLIISKVLNIIYAAGMLTTLSVLSFQPAQAAALPCATSDVSLKIGGTTYGPSECKDGVNNGSPTQEAANMNTSLGTSNFSFLAKSDGTKAILNGIQFA